MTRDGGNHRWQRGLATALLATAPLVVHAQATTRTTEALRLIDANQCEPAIDTINQGMLAGEPKAFYVAGQLFQYGLCLVANVPRALRLYERGALLGDRDCARTLALLHARGDGVAQSYQQAGRWYAVMNQEKVGLAAPSPESFKEPDAVVRTYIQAVNDQAIVSMTYPNAAIDKGVTGKVKVRFDPRFGRVRLVDSSDNVASGSSSEPNRHDFERALLAGYADAIRLLPQPSMSVNVDNSVEREVVFDRKVGQTSQPPGLQALAR